MEVRHESGLVTASVLAMVLVGLISGALVGLVLRGLFARHLVLAILCAIVAAILALIIRNVVLERRAASTGPMGIDFLWVVIASLIGGLAGHELAVDLTEPPPLPLVGALSGLVSSVLIASFSTTIFMLRKRLSVPDK
jgi:hypothetical protein